MRLHQFHRIPLLPGKSSAQSGVILKCRLHVVAQFSTDPSFNLFCACAIVQIWVTRIERAVSQMIKICECETTGNASEISGISFHDQSNRICDLLLFETIPMSSSKLF